MGRWGVALLVALGVSLAAQAAERFDRPGDYRGALTVQGMERAYLLHVPPAAKQGAALPLVIALHGGGGDMERMARDDLFGLISKADRAGFVVAFPNGYSRLHFGKFATWNAGRCCGAARDRNSDDVGFLRQVIETFAAQASIDRKRVFAIGLSNGGMMAYRLACEAPELLRGIMAVAGTDNTVTCAPSRPVAVLHIHARDDDHVLFKGGRGPAAVNADLVTDFTSVPATIEKWTRLNRAGVAKPVLTFSGAACTRSEGAAPVQLCVTENGGHSWPGGAKARGEAPSQAIRATDVMWGFFSGL
ncbi:esterase [Elstera cyanobacteriorum]|uniref:Polyhydroxybutyrate depolymerase n=1 Tax=Elstera cyanobacteriorum TaxID=2022747 RepID=A0A255XL49_9PROT|nr:PHB depolymerase family esterase [Elstera cyanobacteriorum]OYQ17000.1 hypothetical protein CHR90_18740 [Elstera cyanobacteriorum]GFZ82618.1 esterase [Elstera cyanobacteriorum]